MCGIVGYTGKRQAQPILLNCLAHLEYRGYDSCGIAVADSSLSVFKDVLRVKEIAQVAPRLSGVTGIGHTRWATHGEPSKINAHPHCDCAGKIAVVHNGIINNFSELKQRLISEGHKIVSQTDSEVIPHLVEQYFHGDLEEAVAHALEDLEGSYAIIVMMAGEPRLVAARKDSPLIIGVGDQENFLGSDVPAVLDYTNRVIYLEDEDLAVLTTDEVSVRHRGRKVKREQQQVSWTVEDARKGGYEHFMLKEIHEQPKVIRETLAEYIALGEPEESFTAADGTIGGLRLVACGTSYHAAMIGRYLIEELVRVPVRVEIASEFCYSGQVASGERAIVITQSGETADVLKAARLLRDKGCPVTAITNVVGSTVSRLANNVIYTRAGPEISVPATKTFMAQLMALYWLALPFARIDNRTQDSLIMELRQLPEKVQQVLDNHAPIIECARELAKAENVFFISRGINYPVVLEGALKLKEISYLHAEGYAAGELKHGPFALLGTPTPVVAVVGKDNTYDAMLASIKEVKARKSPVIAVVPEDDTGVAELVDTVLYVPPIPPVLSPVVNTVVLQLLAYYTARERGCPIDFPRNLAKSVTVE
ncbi:MAG: glutamine--fructose-6-phosphate transaminase (isomerizing) [Chloroflexota bacterium]